MQNKNLPVIIIVLVTLAIGGYLLLRSNEQDDNETKTEEPSNEDVQVDKDDAPAAPEKENESPDKNREATVPTPRDVDQNTNKEADNTPTEYVKPIAINLSHAGKNSIQWNSILQESDIQLTYEFEWGNTKDGPKNIERVTRTIRSGSPDANAGSYTICPQNEIERKLHRSDVRITLTTVTGGKTKSKTITVKNFHCKC